jgi:hypothetical protein
MFLYTPGSGTGSTSRLDDALVAALAELRRLQAKESEKAGPSYRAGLEDLGWYVSGTEYVVTDELGVPPHPEAYSDDFTRMLKRAGLRNQAT